MQGPGAAEDGQHTASGGHSWRCAAAISRSIPGKNGGFRERREPGRRRKGAGKAPTYPQPMATRREQGPCGRHALPASFRPFFPLVRRRLLLSVAGRLCSQRDIRSACGFQEVSSRGGACLQPFLPPSCWLNSSCHLEQCHGLGHENDTQQINKEGDGAPDSMWLSTQPGVFAPRLQVHEQEMHIYLVETRPSSDISPSNSRAAGRGGTQGAWERRSPSRLPSAYALRPAGALLGRLIFMRSWGWVGGWVGG